jgi:hypothetical protein
VVEKLDHIPLEDLEQIPCCNLKLLTTVSTQTSVKPDGAGSREGRRNGLRKHLETEYPLEHIEQVSVARFRFTKGQRELVDKAIELAKAIHEIPGQMKRWNWIADFYLDAHPKGATVADLLPLPKPKDAEGRITLSPQAYSELRFDVGGTGPLLPRLPPVNLAGRDSTYITSSIARWVAEAGTTRGAT